MKTAKYARDKVHSEIIPITPATAVEMLATMPPGGNRHVRHLHVDTLAGLIRGGHWQTSHMGIAFDTEGRLIDGQHRLSAIVQADIPVELMVSYGFAPEVMDSVDRGLTRQIGDVLQLQHGISGNSVLTSITFVIQREFLRVRTNQTVASALDIYRAYQPGIDWAMSVMASRTVMNKAAVRAALALGWMATDMPEELKDFVQTYRTGPGRSRRDPAYRLREFVIKSALEKRRMAPGELFMISCNAMMAHLNGQDVNGVSRADAAVRELRERLGLGKDPASPAKGGKA